MAYLHDVGFNQAIALLPARYRWVTILAVGEGLSAQEIAALTGVEEVTVLTILKRGLVMADEIHQGLVSVA